MLLNLGKYLEGGCLLSRRGRKSLSLLPLDTREHELPSSQGLQSTPVQEPSTHQRCGEGVRPLEEPCRPRSPHPALLGHQHGSRHPGNGVASPGDFVPRVPSPRKSRPRQGQGAPEGPLCRRGHWRVLSPHQARLTPRLSWEVQQQNTRNLERDVNI